MIASGLSLGFFVGIEIHGQVCFSCLSFSHSSSPCTDWGHWFSLGTSCLRRYRRDAFGVAAPPGKNGAATPAKNK